jgi:hypothetical protein
MKLDRAVERVRKGSRCSISTDELVWLAGLSQDHMTGPFVLAAALQTSEMAPEANRNSTMGIIQMIEK